MIYHTGRCYIILVYFVKHTFFIKILHVYYYTICRPVIKYHLKFVIDTNKFM